MRILSPSYFRLNYNLGRTHSGMIAYLAEYWQDGIEAPLCELLEGMGLEALPSGTLLKPVLEYNNVDLALVDDNDQPLLLVEMKVDDAEGYKKLRSTDRLIWERLSQQVLQRCYSTHETVPDYLRQTELYTLRHEMAYGDNPRCLFITLGTGEYAADFDSCGQVWKHCGLERFVKAVRAIDLDDELFNQWRLSLEKELSLRETCWPEEQSAQQGEDAKLEADSGDRMGLLQLMRLGRLCRELLDKHGIDELGYPASVYKYGANADTIMNFVSPTDQEPGGFRYCEINSNGQLNFKIFFHGMEKDRAAKQQQVVRFQQELQSVLGEDLKLNQGGKYGKTKTVARLPIGLSKGELLPKTGESPPQITARIANYLKQTQSLFPSIKKLAS